PPRGLRYRSLSALRRSGSGRLGSDNGRLRKRVGRPPYDSCHPRKNNRVSNPGKSIRSAGDAAERDEAAPPLAQGSGSTRPDEHPQKGRRKPGGFPPPSSSPPPPP